jgi:hypothetical protein
MFTTMLQLFMDIFSKLTHMLYQIQITPYLSLGDLLVGNFVVLFALFIIWKIMNVSADGYKVNSKTSTGKDSPMFISMNDNKRITGSNYKMITGNKTYRNY